jgi:hypothetical protein
MYTLKGNIKVIKGTQAVNEKFRKREFVVTDNSSQYPQDILLQATQDRCDILDAYKPGDMVEVSFNIRGREWTSPKDGEVKYFNSLEVFKVQNLSGAETPVAPAVEFNTSDEADDLPF